MFRTLSRIAALGAAAWCLTLSCPAKPREQTTTASLDKRVESMLSKLTLDEKLSLLGGVRRFHVPGIPRLGLPELNLADGPVGIRDKSTSTAYPSTECLAASWDPALARAFGASLGRDASARGYQVILGPGINIIRVPTDGRNYEYLSEDPWLASRMAEKIVRGIQSQGVAATPKHFVANNQETHRMSLNVIVSKRALREIYLPAFKAAVKNGGAWMIMDAYNKVNGTYCTANAWLNRDVLKGEWGFRGVVMSDWGAAHDTLGIAFGGLDLEMPGPHYYWPAKLKPLIKSGKIPMGLIDDKVRRLIRAELALGFDKPRHPVQTRAQSDAASAKVALRVAREGIVLLKNNDHALPLQEPTLKRIVVLGPNAAHVPFAGGSGNVTPWRKISVLEALRQLAPATVSVKHVIPTPITTFDNLFPKTRYDSPLTLDYHKASFAPEIIASASASQIDVDWSKAHVPTGVDSKKFYAVWTGKITPKKSGLHIFILDALTRDASVSVDGRIVVAVGDSSQTQTAEGGLVMNAGKTYSVKATFTRGSTEKAHMRVAWGPAPQKDRLSKSQRETIANADAVVACIGFDAPTEGEGADRSYALPTLQKDLVTEASSLNKRVIVVLNSGGSVETRDWLPNVPALLQEWYPGQEGGRAVAEILLGLRSPSGKLPISWEKRWADTPVASHFPGSDDHVDYAEGVLVGYRWYDAEHIAPLFPFGFGLSYTHFKFGDLSVTGPDKNGDVTASFTITNTGRRKGSEVAQLYVAPPSVACIRPPRELKGFKRVTLEPGQSRRVSIHLNRSDLAWFDPQSNQWTVSPGEYQISVGSSSRDRPLSAAITLKPDKTASSL